MVSPLLVLQLGMVIGMLHAACMEAFGQSSYHPSVVSSSLYSYLKPYEYKSALLMASENFHNVNSKDLPSNAQWRQYQLPRSFLHVSVLEAIDMEVRSIESIQTAIDQGLHILHLVMIFLLIHLFPLLCLPVTRYVSIRLLKTRR